MIRNWLKFKGWCVLEYFLLHPDSRVHINELSRRLGIGLYTAQTFCSAYHKDGLFNKTEVGNVHQFYLNERDSRVRALKRFMGPYLAADEIYLKPFLEKNKNILSVTIYGSFASGEYGDRSDLDILILTADERKPKTEDFASIELKLGREIGIISMSFAKWRELEGKKDAFFLTVKKKHVVAWGNPI